MTEFYVVYHVASGEPRWRGSGATGAADLQTLDPGLAAVVVPYQVIADAEIDLGVMRQAMHLSVDAQAELVRMRYLTPGAGQAMTYQRKEAEARAWTADNSTAAPFLSGEAAVRQMTLAELAAEVIRQADAWVSIGSTIEGLRMGAKSRVAAADTFGAIVQASQVNWNIGNA